MQMEYSIISRGTERKGRKGYMAISERTVDGNRVIVPQNHGGGKVYVDDTCLVCPDINITNLVVMRFQLIALLAIKTIKSNEIKRACVFGSGAVGFATVIECFRLGIDAVLVSKKKYIDNHFATIEFENLEIEKYDLLIDCTGSYNVLDYIIFNCSQNSTILLIGVPPEKCIFDIHIIHKKNLQLIGGHEINGINWTVRQMEFEKLYNWHKNKMGEFDKYIQFHHYSISTLEKILNNNIDKPFNVFKY